MGCPGRPRFAGVVSRVAELQRFCRRRSFWPKCGRTRDSAFRRRTGGPVLKPTRGRPHPRNGLPRAARICGGRLPRCRATAVLPPSGVTPKCGWTRVWAFDRRTGSPIAPPRCAPSLGVPSRALAAGVALGPADCVPCARPSAAASARLDPWMGIPRWPPEQAGVSEPRGAPSAAGLPTSCDGVSGAKASRATPPPRPPGAATFTPPRRAPARGMVQLIGSRDHPRPGHVTVFLIFFICEKNVFH
jgi:hypothetical protein